MTKLLETGGFSQALVLRDFEVGDPVYASLPGFELALLDQHILVLKVATLHHKRLLRDPNMTIGPLKMVADIFPEA